MMPWKVWQQLLVSSMVMISWVGTENSGGGGGEDLSLVIDEALGNGGYGPSSVLEKSYC